MVRVVYSRWSYSPRRWGPRLLVPACRRSHSPIDNNDKSYTCRWSERYTADGPTAPGDEVPGSKSRPADGLTVIMYIVGGQSSIQQMVLQPQAMRSPVCRRSHSHNVHCRWSEQYTADGSTAPGDEVPGSKSRSADGLTLNNVHCRWSE